MNTGKITKQVDTRKRLKWSFAPSDPKTPPEVKKQVAETTAAPVDLATLAGLEASLKGIESRFFKTSETTKKDGGDKKE